MQARSSSLLAGIVATGINRALMAAGPFLLVPLFTRYLGAQEYGVWLTALSVTSYFGLLNLGIAQVVFAVAAREAAHGSITAAAGTISTAFVTYVFLAGTAWVLLSGAVASLHLFGSPWSSVATMTVWVTATFFLFALPLQIFQATLRACQRVTDEQAISAMGVVSRYAAMTIALLVGIKLPGIAVVHGALGLLPGWIAFARLKRVIPELKVRVRTFRKSEMVAILRPSSWFLVLQVAGMLSFSVDVVVIASALGASRVPAFAVPMQLIMMFQAAASIMTSAATPKLVALIARGDRPAAHQLLFDLVCMSTAAGAIASTALLLAGREALLGWGGASIVPDRSTLIAMAAFLAVQSALIPCDAVLVGALRHRLYATVSLIEGMLNLALSLALVRPLGPFGVILATLVARALTNAWYLPARAARVIQADISLLGKAVFKGFIVPCAVGSAVGWLARSASSAVVAAAAAMAASIIAAAWLNLPSMKRLALARA